MSIHLSLTKFLRRTTNLFADTPRKRLFVRNRLRKWCVSEELITGTNAGFQMYASPHDYASYGIFFYGEYDLNMTNFMKAYILEGDVCLDIGAERGWFTLLMASLVGITGRVDSFEAFPVTFQKLRNNIELNNFTWVNCNNVAISGEVGKMYFIPPSNEVTHHQSYLEDCSGVGYLSDIPSVNSILVPTITIDSYVENHPVERLDLIKIDIEGAEYDALLGSKKSIQKFSPKIVIEYNRETAKRAGTSVEELDSVLEDFGYDRYLFPGRLKAFDLEKWKDLSDAEAVLNVYCFSRSKNN